MVGSLAFCISGLVFDFLKLPVARIYPITSFVDNETLLPWDVMNRYKFSDYLAQTFTRYLADLVFQRW
jgi:hypothetical protein